MSRNLLTGVYLLFFPAVTQETATVPELLQTLLTFSLQILMNSTNMSDSSSVSFLNVNVIKHQSMMNNNQQKEEKNS